MLSKACARFIKIRKRKSIVLARVQIYVGAHFAHNGNAAATKSYLATLLKEVMGSLQMHLEAMMRGSPAHSRYMDFSREVISCIRSRASDIQPLTDFFATSSPYYWPKDTDPHQYVDGLVSYCLKLADDTSGKVSSELFHYLWRDWRSSFIKDEQGKHVEYIKQALKIDHGRKKCIEHFEFFEFLLKNYIPAALEAGFYSKFGWLVVQTYLPLLANKICYLFQKNYAQALVAFGHIVNLLKIIFNGVVNVDLTWEGGNIEGAHPKHRGIIAITAEFWLSIRQVLRGYVLVLETTVHYEAFSEVADALDTFIQHTISKFRYGHGADFGIGHLCVIQGTHVRQFVAILDDDFNKLWAIDLNGIQRAMQFAGGSVDIKDLAPNRLRHYKVELYAYWGPTLAQVLGVGWAAEDPPSYSQMTESRKHHMLKDQDAEGFGSGRVVGEVLF